MPYDPDEDQVFLSCGKSIDQSNMPTISQIFDRIRVLIMSSDSSVTLGVESGGLIASRSQGKNSLKADLQKPFSIILKHVISSGIEGFKSGTDGNKA